MRYLQPGNQLHLLLLYAAYGWLLLSGTLHFAIDVAGQYARGKRSPSAVTTLYYGLNSAYASSQVLFAALALFAISQGLIVLGRWPAAESGLSGCFDLGDDMCPISGLSAAPYDPWTVCCPSRRSGPDVIKNHKPARKNNSFTKEQS